MSIRIGKSFRVLIIALLAAVSFIVAASAVISIFYEDALVRYLKKYLDQHLLTQISMEDIHFSMLKRFPNATVDIRRAVVLSGPRFSVQDFNQPFADTLLQAGEVTFQFDLVSLFQKNYILKKIEIHNGSLHILTDRSGRNNLNIWKSTDSSASEQSEVDLRSITLSHMHVSWIDLRSGANLQGECIKTAFHGKYAREILTGDLQGNFIRTTVRVNNAKWVDRAAVGIQMNFAYLHKRFVIHDGQVKLNKALILITGNYQGGEKPTLDLALQVPKFGLQELISLFPVQSDSLFHRYRFTGTGSLKASLKGPLSDADHLQIASDFRIERGSARNTATRALLSDVSLSGNISGTRADNFRLILHDFSFRLGKGTSHGNLSLKNLHTLLLQADISADLDLGACKDFLNLDTVDYLNGRVKTHFMANGPLAGSIADSSAAWMRSIRTGTFLLQDVAIKLHHSNEAYSHITGKALLNGHLNLDSMKVRVNDNDLLVNGTLDNVPGYLLEHGFLQANLAVSTRNLSINSYLHQNSSAGGRKSANPFFPPRINLQAQLQADGFVANKFHATDLNMVLTLIGDSAYIQAFSMKFPDGTLAGDALVAQNKQGILSVTCNSKVRHIDIQELFTAFNNFSQDFIVDKNVEGSLDGTIRFIAQWDSSLNFMSNGLKANADLEITNGRLVKFAPMLKLSRYIRVDELQLITFQTLRNVISIHDRQVFIPEMEIHSSAFNISVSGTHSFDNRFDYRVRVLLSEVLFNKARKKRKEMDEFMVDNQSEGTAIPLIIAGTPDNFDVKFDRKRAFDLTRKNLGKSASGDNDSNSFRIEWDEGKKKAAHSGTTPEVTRDKDFRIEWDEDTTHDPHKTQPQPESP